MTLQNGPALYRGDGSGRGRKIGQSAGKEASDTKAHQKGMARLCSKSPPTRRNDTFSKSSPLKVCPHSPLEELPITNPPSELQQSPGRHGRLRLGGSFFHGHPARRGPSRRDSNSAVLAVKSHSPQPRPFLSFIRLGERVSRGNLSRVHRWA